MAAVPALKSPRVLLWWGAGTMLTAISLGVLITLGHDAALGVDQWWNDAIGTHRSDWMLSFALTLNHIGGGWVAILVVPFLVIVLLVMTRRWRGAVFVAAALAASAGVVQLLKTLYRRDRPDDMLVTSDVGAFPSGHVANAATIAIVLSLLFPRVWVAVAGAVWVVAMALSRTLLSVHWATDTLGGALVGVSVVLFLAAWLLPWARTTSPRRPRLHRRATDPLGPGHPESPSAMIQVGEPRKRAIQ